MTELPIVEVFGFWLGVFLTFCILSFLYADNPFYKFAEHLFIGISIGYIVIQQYFNVLEPKLVVRLHPDNLFLETGEWFLALIALLLVVLMFVKAASKRLSWMGRYPLAFVVAFFAGLQINGVVQGDLGQQLSKAAQSVDAEQVNINTATQKELLTLPGVSPAVATAIVDRRERQPFTSVAELEELEGIPATDRDVLITERRAPGAPVYRMWVAMDGLDAQASVKDGDKFWFGILSNILLLLGTLCSLVYFYFSVAHKGVVGRVSRIGIWVLMIGFGASFGYTVMGRLSLAIGRAQYVLGYKDATVADQVHFRVASIVSIAVIVVGLIVWEIRRRRRGDPDDT